MTHARLWSICLVTALLGACGSNDDEAAPVPPIAASDAIPDAASQSVEGMATWITQLAAEDAEAKAALDVARFMPPTADDTEPLALN